MCIRDRFICAKLIFVEMQKYVYIWKSERYLIEMKNTMHSALHEGSKIVLENFGKITNYEVKESQSSIVTRADVDSEKKIMEVILQSFPGHNTLGEETGFQNRNSEYTWLSLIHILGGPLICGPLCHCVEKLDICLLYTSHTLLA